MKTKTKDRLFDMMVLVLITITVIVCLLPFLHVFAISLSSTSAIIQEKVWIWPVELDFQSYLDVIRDKSMTGSLVFTTELTLLFTAICMLMTVIAAYPLTQKRLRGRKFLLFVILFTMFFSGGIIPDYLLVKNLNLLNKIWCLVLPGAISTFNLIILKTFFTSLPESLIESARIDGCSDIGILFKIVLPLSVPVLATLSLFYAVGRWNYFQDALFYITDPKLYPLQEKLYQVIMTYSNVDIAVIEGSGITTNIPPDSMRAACIMFATIPIVLIYPWLQGYFIKGVMIGAIKG